jgi:SAM-dependent methyltransferase
VSGNGAMTWRALPLLLVACNATQSASVSRGAPSASTSNVVVPTAGPSGAAESSTEGTAAGGAGASAGHGEPSAASKVGAASDHAAALAAPSPSSSAEHQHGHHHGKDGYHMDFSEVERFARHFDGPERDAWQKPAEVVRFLELGAGQVIADIGAGTGYFLPPLSKAVGATGHVLALDVEPNMVEYAKQRSRRASLANVEARVVQPDDPGLAPSSVDRILIVDTWHHIDDRANYAAKLARSLRPSGALLIVDFTLESDQGPPREHRLAPDQVIAELKEGGFQAEVVRDETLPKQYLVRGTVPAPSPSK